MREQDWEGKKGKCFKRWIFNSNRYDKTFFKTRFISHFQINRYVNYNRYSKQNHLKTSIIYF